MTERILLDTNVLVYSCQADSANHVTAKEFIEKLVRNSDSTVSVQNLVEFSRVVTEKFEKPIPPNEVRLIVDGFAKTMTVISYDAQTVSDAISFSAAYRLHLFDALLAATMQKEGINHIVTENEKDFRKIPWLKVTNPFK